MQVSKKQAARLAGVSEATIYTWIHEGKRGAKLRATRTHTAGHAWEYAIDTGDLAAFAPLDPARLREVAQGAAHTPAGIEARLAALEAQMRSLQRAVLRLSGQSEGADEPSRYADVAPPRLPESHPTRTEVSGHASQLVRLGTFAKLHDFSDSTARRWLTREAKEGRTQWARVEQNPSRGDQDAIWLTVEGQTALLAHFAKLHP